MGLAACSDIRPVNLHIKSHTQTFITQEMNFTVGEPYETDMPAIVEGKFKSSPTWEGEKLVMQIDPIDAKCKPFKNVRELVGNELIQTMDCNGQVCVRRFEKTE